MPLFGSALLASQKVQYPHGRVAVCFGNMADLIGPDTGRMVHCHQREGYFLGNDGLTGGQRRGN